MTPNDMLQALIGRRDLTAAEATELMNHLLDPALDAAVKAGLLTALRAKGETADELAALAARMRNLARRLPDEMRAAIDTCGTGGDGLCTLNVSTLSALTLSAMGVPVVKHGNRSVSSKCGSADLLEALGVPLQLDPDQALARFKKSGFVFLFAPAWHPAMKEIMPVRKALGVPTVFNLLGPLCNPARVDYQVLGVANPDLIDLFADALARLGVKRAAVVHGEPGMDEVSPCGDTHVMIIGEGSIESSMWTLKDFGVTRVDPVDLRISGLEESVARARELISGRGRAADRVAVSINVAAALWVAGRADSLKAGCERAQETLATNAVAEHLEKIIADHD